MSGEIAAEKQKLLDSSSDKQNLEEQKRRLEGERKGIEAELTAEKQKLIDLSAEKQKLEEQQEKLRGGEGRRAAC